jgi:hypothetical protein
VNRDNIYIYCDLSHHLMAWAYYRGIIVECVSAILFQLIYIRFSHIVILASPNVYSSSIKPLLPLSIESSLFVYLYWAFLPSWDICPFLVWVYRYFPPLSIKLSVHTPLCWPPILHLTKWFSTSTFIYISKRSIM